MWVSIFSGSKTWLLCVMVVVFVPLLNGAPSAVNLEVLSQSNVLVKRGQTAILPCWLNPAQSAEDLEVSWNRGSEPPVVVYRERKPHYASQNTYEGRVLFEPRSPGGLASGDVSLKLLNVTIEDGGIYTCYVSSEQEHDHAVVHLSVTETGGSVLLSGKAGETDQNMMNISCQSAGWYPKPNLQWYEQEKAVTPESLDYSTDSSGLQSVHSWLLVPSSFDISCSVGLPGEEPKKGRLRLDNPPAPEPTTGWTAFFVLLILILVFVAALIAVLFWKKRSKRFKEKPENAVKGDETDKPLLNCVTKILPHLDQYYVNVKLPQMEHQFLIIKGNMLRDKGSMTETTWLTAITGKPGFSSGKHYWEVSLFSPNIEPKQSWWLGVTQQVSLPLKPTPPTAGKDCWFLSSSSQNPEQLLFTMEDTQVSVCVSSKPGTVGVYLDYDAGILTFYDVEKEAFIGSLTAQFRGEVFPLFNPGTGDKSPMRILQRVKEETSESPLEQETES